MAITSSAKKAIRSSARKRIFNLHRKTALLRASRKIERAVKEGSIKEAIALLPAAYTAIDKAAKTNFLKKNTAARMKSRLAQFIQRNVK